MFEWQFLGWKISDHTHLLRNMFSVWIAVFEASTLWLEHTFSFSFNFYVIIDSNSIVVYLYLFCCFCKFCSRFFMYFFPVWTIIAVYQRNKWFLTLKSILWFFHFFYAKRSMPTNQFDALFILGVSQKVRKKKIIGKQIKYLVLCMK